MIRSPRRVAVVALFLSTYTIRSLAQSPPAWSTRDVSVHGHHLTFHVLPGSSPALVSDAGGGADSSYWFFTGEEVAHMGPIIQPMVAAEAAAHPSKQTRTLKAITDAYVETSRAFHKAAWPASIPCAVIVSERTPLPPSMTFDTALWIQAHKDFAGKAPNRTLIFAKGSSHDIAHDRPELIVQATV